jgi:hypothetical protein
MRAEPSAWFERSIILTQSVGAHAGRGVPATAMIMS